MKIKVWLHIPKKHRRELMNWNNFYSYNSFDVNLGDVAAYNLIAETDEYKTLVEYLALNKIQYDIFRREFNFTKKEINKAEIQKLIIDGNAGESFSTDHEGYLCPTCQEKIPKLKINNLHVHYKQIKRFDILATYMGAIEIIVSERLKNILLKEHVSGSTFKSIFEIGNNGKEIPGYYHLNINEGIGEVVEPSIIEKDEKCCECGFYRRYLTQTPLNFKRNTWSGLDICYTKNWFGSPPIDQGKWVVISKKLYNILINNKIKLFSVEPAFFVD